MNTSGSSSDERLDDDHVVAIARGISSSNVPLLTLSLTNHRITDIGFDTICSVIVMRRQLLHLDLDGNSIEGNNMSVLGLSNRECSLKKLNLSNNPLSKTAGMRIADDMRTNTGLVSLEIRNNGLCLSVIIALATTLQLSRCLEVLSIDRPLLDISTKQEEGIDHLSRLLESVFCPLQQLSIRYHCIGDIGAKFLSSSLRNNYILTYLDLERNRIGPSGCEALATHLLLRKESGSKICLKTLLLSYNIIIPKGR